MKSDPAISSSVTIVVNPIKVSKITVNGYGKDYLVKDDTVTLTTTVEPGDAANKSIVWSSSNEEVATVDQNGKVTAVGQGTVSIKAMNDDSGVYGEQVITVYDNTPITKTVNVWVTNESQDVSYQFNIPVNGTEVSPSQVARNTSKGDKTLVSTAQFRVLNNTVAQQRVWATISSVPIVKSFKYNQKKKKVEYTTDGQTWKTISSDEQIYDFTSMQWKGTDNKTDVKVAVGDWPYGSGVATGHKNQTIQIIVLNTEGSGAKVYDSGVMRYDNGSNGQYGKIYFDCDTSKFEVSKVEVYRNGSLKESYTGSKIPKLINVQFEYNQTNKYVVKAYIKAKTIHVNYDANKGTGAPKGTTVKSTDKVTVDSTTRPTRDGYIFTGWTYGGKLYQGGESFDAPTSDVTFVAQWAKASDVINYTVNDSKMGSVSRSYERIGETVQGNVQGSTAIAETGYRFVKWVKGTDPKADAVSTDIEYKPTTKGTYMAVFEAVTSDLVIRYVDTDGKDISDSETKSYKYGESYTETAKEIKGYSLKSESPITGTKGVAREEIIFTYTQKEGKVVYNLGPNGSWGNGSPENVVVFDAAKGKWAYNYGFDKGDTFVVTDSVPTSSDNAVFVGWYDKKRDTTSATSDTTSATMRKAGEKVTYPYTESSKTNSYTLDALWEKLQGADKVLPYDGNKHSLDEFTVKFANENLQGWTDSASSLVQASNIQYRLKQDGREVNEWGAMPSFKDAGVYTVEAKATVNGVELAAEATLTITPKSVTLTTESATRAYNGQPLTAPGTITGFVEGEGAKVVTTKSQTAIGETSNDGYNIVWDENTKESNYSVNVGEIGTLTVTDQSIEDSKKITVGTLSNVVYTGKNQKQEPAVTTKDGKTTLVKETDYTLSYSKDTKNVGEVTVTVTGKGNYSGTVQRKYQITKAPLTVETQSDSKVYDGKPLTAPGTVKGFVEGENAELQVTGTQTAVGSSKNTYKIVWTETTKADNYQVSETVGTLTVTAQSIDPGTDPEKPNPDYTGAKVNSPSDKVYDGNEHKWIPTVTDKADKKLEAGTDYTVEYSTMNFKDVGTVEVTITGKGNYTGTVKRSYKVTPKEYTVTTDSATKTYSGTALTAGGKVEGIVSGETVEFTTTGSQTEVGTSKNTYELVWKSAKATNYTLAKESIGKLTVKAKSIIPDGPDTPDEKKTGITVTKPSDSKYDGEEHKNKPTVTDTKTNRTLVEGTDYELSYSKDVTNAGTVTVTVTGIGNYEGSFEVTYEITKRNVTLTSGSASKVYDKTALTKDEVTVSGDGFAKDEGATYKVTGSRTKVGTSKNTFTYELKSNTTATNYNIEVKFGELKVTAQDGEVVVTITGRSDTVEYDGNEKSVSGYDVSITEGSKYTTSDFTFNGTAEAKGTEAGTYSMGLNADQFTNTNDNYTQVTFIVNDGTLTINPKSITPDGPDTPKEEKTGITVTDPENSIYDGNEHINGLTVTDSKLNTTLVEGTDYTLTYSGDLINVGTVTITVKGIGNYTGEFTKTYQILPREYTVTTNTDSKVYDGTALTAGGTVNNLVDGETVNLTMTGSQTDVGTSDNTYELKFEGTAKESNYTHGKDSIGTLTVTKKSIVPDGPNTPDEKKTGITVSEPSDSKYDGKEHKEVLTVTDTKTGKELVAGTDYSVTYSSDLVNAGTVTMKVAGLGNYTGSFTKTYKITKRSVTLTSATVSKVYDGSALTNTSIAVSGDGFVEGEGASYEVTGTQTEVGNSANAFEYKLNENTLASNYSITKVVGTLTITAAPAPVTPATPSTPSSTTSTTPRTPSAPQVTTPVETVEKETTPKAEPKKEEKVEEEYTPKASPQYYWALINLICAILTVLFGLLLLISKRHKDEDDDEEDDETKDQTTTNDDEDKEQEKKRGLFTRVLAVLIAIVSVVFFLVTEDLSLPWTWTDQWTIWMVVIGLVQIVVFFVGRKWKNVDNDDDDEEAQQA